jgi:hypothetical protein
MWQRLKPIFEVARLTTTLKQLDFRFTRVSVKKALAQAGILVIWGGASIGKSVGVSQY